MNGKQVSLYYELRGNLGEDAEPLVEDRLIGVFDGMGGAGGLEFEDQDGVRRTNAYMASRLAQNCVKNFYKNNKEELFSVFNDKKNLTLIIEKLVNALLTDFGRYANENRLSNKIRVRSRLIKLLPTTMAVAVVKDNDNSVDVLCLWAGDSRCYILSPHDGLQQLTIDDLKMPNDAMKNIIDDSPMSNYIQLPLSGDSKTPQFKINGNIYTNIPKPCIVFTATDGCFGYVKSPMSFEYLILKSIETVKNTNKSFDSLGTIIKDFLIKLPTSDDCSLAGLAFAGDLSESEFFELYIQRQSKMRSEYIEKVDEKEIDELSQCIKTYSEDRQLYEKEKIEELISILSSQLFILWLSEKPLSKVYDSIDCINELFTKKQKKMDKTILQQLDKIVKRNQETSKKALTLLESDIIENNKNFALYLKHINSPDYDEFTTCDSYPSEISKTEYVEIKWQQCRNYIGNINKEEEIKRKYVSDGLNEMALKDILFHWNENKTLYVINEKTKQIIEQEIANREELGVLKEKQLKKKDFEQICKDHGEKIFQLLMKLVQDNNDIQDVGCEKEIALVKTAYKEIKSKDNKIEEIKDKLNRLKDQFLSVEMLWNTYKYEYEAYLRRRN